MCRKLFYAISIALVVSLAGSARAELVAHWRLEDGSGTTAIDSSANGNDGTLNGDPRWADGQIGGALDFDGNGDDVLRRHQAVSVGYRLHRNRS